MIYILFGEHRLRNKLVQTWKDAFAKKWDQNNIFHIRNVYEYDAAFYGQTLLGEGLFSQKTLCIVDDAEFFVETKNDFAREYADFFLSIFPRMSEDVTLVFNQGSIDQRSKFFKDAKPFVEMKDFRLEEKGASVQQILKLYGEYISPGILQKLTKKVGEDFSVLSGEIEKLLITKTSIQESDLAHVSLSREENIFEIIDLLLGKHLIPFTKKLRLLAHDTGNPYLLYSMLMANLRPHAYIFLLKKQGKTPAEISRILELGKRSFLAEKKYPLSPDTFLVIYQRLLKIDAKMKSGHMLGSEISDMLYEIERVLLISQTTK